MVLYLDHVHVPLKLVHELPHHGHHLYSVRHALFLLAPFPIFVVQFPFAVDFCPAICPVISESFEWPVYCIVLVVATIRPLCDPVWWLVVAVSPLQRLTSNRFALPPNCTAYRAYDVIAMAWLLASSDWPSRSIAAFDMIVHQFAALVVFVAIESVELEHHLQ